MQINGIQLVTDRSLSDVEIAKALTKKGLQGMTAQEKEQYTAGLKGAYNVSDINRVESVVQYLVVRLLSVPNELKSYADTMGVPWYDVFDVDYDTENYVGLTHKTDWKRTDVFSESDRHRYMQNIMLVLIALLDDVDGVPETLDALTHKGANNIEKELFNANNALSKLQNGKERLIIGTKNAWYYSGDLYGGEL